jgi:hypothetical protein
MMAVLVCLQEARVAGIAVVHVVGVAHSAGTALVTVSDLRVRPNLAVGAVVLAE